MTLEKETIHHWVTKNKKKLLHILSDLVHFETVSPPARNTARIQQFIDHFLQEAGFETDQFELYPGDINLTAIKKGTDRTRYQSLLLNGHVDVADVGDTSLWTVPPFELTIQDGMAYGRGVSDMKGSLAAALLAMSFLKQHDIQLKGDLSMQFATGEEAGEAGTKACVERGSSADFAIVMDTSNLRIEGQGGVITGWLTIQSDQVFHDAMRRRMIHAGGGVKGFSAVEKMAKVITGLNELERDWAIQKSYPGFEVGTNTINPAVIEGGRHAAFVADECRLWLTVHFYPDETAEGVSKEIEDYVYRLVDSDVSLSRENVSFQWGGKSMIEDRGEIFPSLELHEDHPAFEKLKQVHQDVFRALPDVGMSTSVTDGGWLGEAGIETVIYGPGTTSEAHSIDEKVKIEDLTAYTEVLISFILDWCNSEKVDPDA
ncbi:acetylornithine deacetylase [Terrilactibacillus sp. BCM23-1]|uniref:Probable succinyl-diaminopimelate desuccinylase n=1 Tax=Terrilactibacillus tamarindi TaxID=2599694 RepID=A0A6N8CVE2_9BACI|nr:acetylornithine deacetylase [Terrilactibacillus tamarindi]MTT33205.1 acetylornithine deacetylase [Terrilactibacillus tamarindi]